MKLTKKYIERFKVTRELVKGRAVSFRIDEITLPENKTALREYLVHPGAVGVLALTSQGKILLVKQYRYPIKDFTLEIPAGKLAKGENPRACVARELEEETGYQAKSFKKLVSFWPTAAFSDEVIHLYVATGLKFTQVNPDEDEFLEILEVSPRTVERLIRTGKIQDSKTLIAYSLWKAKIV